MAKNGKEYEHKKANEIFRLCIKCCFVVLFIRNGKLTYRDRETEVDGENGMKY